MTDVASRSAVLRAQAGQSRSWRSSCPDTCRTATSASFFPHFSHNTAQPPFTPPAPVIQSIGTPDSGRPA
jgi:hypothetical protein